MEPHSFMTMTQPCISAGLGTSTGRPRQDPGFPGASPVFTQLIYTGAFLSCLTYLVFKRLSNIKIKNVPYMGKCTTLIISEAHKA